ncbi:hypothetical protein LguiA_018429 [Lonicera macranthoides]
MAKRNLPENVKIEIFSRLPVKTLLRFKCVCKSCYTMFESPTFITKHLHHKQDTNLNHHSRCLVVCCEKVTEKYFAIFLANETLNRFVDLELPKFGYRRFSLRSILNSCNGIVCLYGNLSDKGTRIKHSIVLLNPATRECKCLPQVPERVSYPPYVNYNYDSLVFGFDSKSNDYKVLRLVRLHDRFRKRNLPWIVQIYTLSSNSWREIDVVVPALIEFDPVFNAYSNGAYNWYAMDPKGRLILSFDFHNEVFRTKRAPDFNLIFPMYAFATVNGHFALVLMKNDGLYNPIMDIWVMIDESWTHHSTIAFGPINKDLETPLAIWGNNKFLFKNREGEIILYDHNTHEINNHKIHGVDSSYIYVAVYDESLVSIQGEKWLAEDTTAALDGLFNIFS